MNNTKKKKNLKETTIATVGYTLGGAIIGYGIARAFRLSGRATLECTGVLGAGGLARGLVVQFRRKAKSKTVKKNADGSKSSEETTMNGKEISNNGDASEYAGALKTIAGVVLVSKVIVPLTVVAAGLVTVGVLS